MMGTDQIPSRLQGDVNDLSQIELQAVESGSSYAIGEGYLTPPQVLKSALDESNLVDSIGALYTPCDKHVLKDELPEESLKGKKYRKRNRKRNKRKQRKASISRNLPEVQNQERSTSEVNNEPALVNCRIN